jgi:hypothetical protein
MSQHQLLYVFDILSKYTLSRNYASKVKKISNKRPNIPTVLNCKSNISRNCPFNRKNNIAISFLVFSYGLFNSFPWTLDIFLRIQSWNF